MSCVPLLVSFLNTSCWHDLANDNGFAKRFLREYPASQKQRNLMYFMLSETVDRWGEWGYISILCLVHSISASCRAQAGLTQQQLESLLLLPVHKKSVLTWVLTALPGSNILSLMTTIWWLLNGENWEPTVPFRDPDVWKQHLCLTLSSCATEWWKPWDHVYQKQRMCLLVSSLSLPAVILLRTASMTTHLLVHTESKQSALVSLSPFWHWSLNHLNWLSWLLIMILKLCPVAEVQLALMNGTEDPV